MPTGADSERPTATPTATPGGAAEDGRPVRTVRLPGDRLSDPRSGAGEALAITMVGDVPVVLDRAAGTVRLPSGPVPLDDAAGGDTAVLQQPGPAADSVIVATSTALLRIALADGSVTEMAHGSPGAPAAPVRLGDCVHGAWSSAPAGYVLACDGRPTVQREVPGHTGSAAMVFRVNGDAIVLNDVVTGATWTADPDLRLINNWDQVRPLSDEQDDPTDNSGTEGSSSAATTSRTNCTAGKTDPPTAADDDFGVRADRSTVLRVLGNDASSDCSVLAITAIDGGPDGDDGARVDIVNEGRALQVTVPAGATGPLPPLRYVVSDGLGRTATARVSIDVVPDTVHRPPVKLHDSSVPVETLGSVSYNVLNNYRSPNGDDLFLVGASVDAANAGDEVTFQPDGLITYFDKGVGGAVKKTVTFEVSDGENTPVSGTLTVDVRPDGTAEPIASPVYAHAVTGRPLSIDILSRVTAPAVDATTLAKITAFDKPAQAYLGAIDHSAGTVVFTGPRTGTYYYLYQVSAGSNTAEGLLRVDVTEPSDETAPPVPMADVVYLPAGGVVTIDPTANDSDPMATGLAVTQARPDPALTATVEAMQTVTVSAQSVLGDHSAQIDYTVSNGAAQADGVIRVVPVPATRGTPPVAHDIDATVRVGDAVTIPIAEHAVDLGGDVIALTSLGTESVPPDTGVLFHTETAIRYLAPETAPATPLRFSYTVTNTVGASATGLVTLRVVPPPEHNRPPAQPQPVLARVFTDATASIALPLSGIDPDGDWVTLGGITEPSSAPLGNPAPSGLSAIEYRAGSAPGYDSFGYQATDPYGETTVGHVAVLVVPRPTMVQAPTAPNLTVTARPGRTVQIDALAQVADANPSQHLTFDDPAFEAPKDWSVRVDDASQTLVVRTPDQDTVQSIKYTVVNEAGQAGSGIITVTVSATAEVPPPTAQDVVVDPADLTPGQTQVEVRIPDERLTNPGGTLADLDLSLDPQSQGAAQVTGDRTVRVPLTSDRQVLAYHVTNVDQAVATAFIVVPSAEEAAPPQTEEQEEADDEPGPLTVTVSGPKLRVKAGETLTFAIGDQVTASDDSALEIPNGARLTVTGGGQVGRVDATHVSYTAAKDGDGTVRLSVPVSDGTRDPVAVTIPVTVIPVVIPAPVVRDASLTVEAGHSASQDLALLVTAGNEEQQSRLTFDISGGADGFTVGRQGSVVTVSASLGAKGESASFTVTATDGQGKSGTGTLVVAATASTAPRLKVRNVTIDDGRPGKASKVDVLDAVTYNPFDTPPSVVDAVVSDGKGTVSKPGSTIAITPDRVGTVVVTVTLRDATGDPDRDVAATVTVTVQDKPDAPGTPTVVSMESHTVQLEWSAPDDNGSPITGYVIASDDGSFTQKCDSSPCALAKLHNGTAYRFTVVAVNAIGTSEPSAASAAVTPDTAPNLPAPPSVQWAAGEHALEVSWTDPGSDGTPVDRYDLRISPADSKGNSEVTVTDGTDYRWPDLEFGTAYTFTVQAHNASDTPSGFSQPSTAETPSGPAVAPTDVAVTFGVDEYQAGGHTLTASWTAPGDDGGSALTGYQIRVSPALGGSGTFDVADPATTSMKLQGAVDGTEYTVTAVALNRSGAGAVSKPATVNPYSLPDAVTGVTAKATGDSKKVALSWSKTSGHGRAIARYEIGGDASGETGASTTSRTVTAPGNGKDYTFKVRACYSDNTCGGWGSATANPYGPVAPPGSVKTSRHQKSVTFSWSNPPDNGRGPMSSQWSTNNKDWHTGTSRKVAGECESTVVIYLRGVDSDGHHSTSKKHTSTTTACPQTRWPATATVGTCPDTITGPSHFQGGRCTSDDGHGNRGFIDKGQTVDVICYSTGWSGNYKFWYQIGSGEPFAGWYIAGATTTLGTDPPSGMPQCS